MNNTVTKQSDSKHLVSLNDQKQQQVLEKIIDVYSDLFSHDGYGDFSIEMKILRRGQKEVIIHCGKQHRFVLDCDQALANESALKHILKRDLLG